MKYKSYIKYFLIFSIILISLLPIYNFYQYAKNYDLKKSFNVDSVEKYVNYIVYKLFNRSMVQEQVITGKDDFLFLGNQYNNILHKTNGIYRPSNDEINNWTNKLKDLQKWYEDRGIKFVIVIAPNKHSIYKEKLPNWMQYDGKTITDDIVEQSNLKGINILDLRSILISHKSNDYLLYTKHETHWNNIGAGIAYNQTIDFLNKKYNLNLNKVEFTTIDYFREISPLGNFLKIESLLKIKENIYMYDMNLKNIQITKINKQNFYYENKVESIINRNIWTNNQPQNVSNKNSLNKEKLLFITDSFSGTSGKIGNSILYNETFSNIDKFHWSHINAESLANFVKKTEPNVVIYQIVERDLYNDKIVLPMPEILKISNIKNFGNSIFDIQKGKYFKNDEFELDLENNIIKLKSIKNDPIIILNQTKSTSKNVILSYEIESSIDTTFQLFYKKENNSKYNQIDSYKSHIKKGNNKINLLIPSEYINNGLRVDLVSNIGNYMIKEFKIFEKK